MTVWRWVSNGEWDYGREGVAIPSLRVKGRITALKRKHHKHSHKKGYG